MRQILRSILRWFFGIQVLIMLGVLAIGIKDRSGNNHVVHESASYFAIALSLLLPFSAAYFTTLKSTGKRNYWAVSACLVDSLIALLLLNFIHPRSILSSSLLTLYLTLNIAGIWLFLQRSLTRNLPPPARTVTRDGTSRVTDVLFSLLFVIGMWKAWGLWDRWVGIRSPLNTRFPWDFFVLCIAGLVIAAIHECGHAIAAARFGMKLLSFTVGPFSWRRVEGRWRFHFQTFVLGGAVSIVRILPNPDWQEVVMLAAGPAANFASTPLFAGASLHLRETNHIYLLFFFSCLTVISATAGVFNLFPFKVGDCAYSDGARIFQVISHSSALNYRRAINQLQATLFTSLRHRDLDPAIYQRAAAGHLGTLAGLHAHLCAAGIFEDRGEIERASAEIAAAEECYENFSVDLPHLLHTTFIFHYASYRRDAASARLWWDRMQKKRITRTNVDYFLSASALAWVEGRQGEAEDAWRSARAEADKLPDFGAYNLDRDRVTLLRTRLDGPAPEPSTTAPSETHAVAQSEAPSDRKSLLVIVGVSAALVALITTTPPGSASALLWHCVHGNSMQLAEYNVRVPFLWRSGGSAEPSLIRVGMPAVNTGARISVIPSDDRPKSDQQVMQKMRRSANLMNKFGKDWSASVVVLKTRSANLYCERLNWTRGGDWSDRVTLYCQAPSSPSMLSYWGPTAYESEAKDIFSSCR